MFDNINSFKLDNLSAFSDNCSPVLKRIKFINNNSFIILENTFDLFIFHHISIDGKTLNKWEVRIDDDMLLDYIFILFLSLSFLNMKKL